jgi:hypothetical protein
MGRGTGDEGMGRENGTRKWDAEMGRGTWDEGQ